MIDFSNWSEKDIQSYNHANERLNVIGPQWEAFGEGWHPEKDQISEEIFDCYSEIGFLLQKYKVIDGENK